MEETERMAEDQLRQRKQRTQSLCCWRRIQPHDTFASLGCGNGVADWADATDSGRYFWHFPERAADTEGFETAKFLDVQAGGMHMASIIKLDRDSGMPFDTANWGYGNYFTHGKLVSEIRADTSSGTKKPGQSRVF
jgi:hypothetical protein